MHPQRGHIFSPAPAVRSTAGSKGGSCVPPLHFRFGVLMLSQQNPSRERRAVWGGNKYGAAGVHGDEHQYIRLTHIRLCLEGA